MALLDVQNLSIGYQTAEGLLQAVDGVSFSLEAGQSLGLVGESGCGKTTIGMALMGLLPPNGRITDGHVLINGKDLRAMDEEAMRKVRWNEVAMIFQAAMNALNPVQRVGAQMEEAILEHQPEMSKEEARKRVEGLYQLVGMSSDRIDDFPHQYSGGMKQRAIIAMALANKPQLIIADEPTTALDVIVQDQILQETINLQREFNIGIIFISHDISIVAEVCQSIGVMYAGQLVEIGTSEQVFNDPHHPYTKALVASFPTLAGERRQLKPIPGEPPHLTQIIAGCRFCDRCPRSEAQCKLERPLWQEVGSGHHILCDHC
jgi:peptide/nickel transport system ATP-binding protein